MTTIAHDTAGVMTDSDQEAASLTAVVMATAARAEAAEALLTMATAARAEVAEILLGMATAPASRLGEAVTSEATAVAVDAPATARVTRAGAAAVTAAAKAAAAGATAEAKTTETDGGGGGGRCHKGHLLKWSCEGEGEERGEMELACDGACGRVLTGRTGWWFCEACDYDLCDVCCGGGEGCGGEVGGGGGGCGGDCGGGGGRGCGSGGGDSGNGGDSDGRGDGCGGGRGGGGGGEGDGAHDRGGDGGGDGGDYGDHVDYGDYGVYGDGGEAEGSGDKDKGVGGSGGGGDGGDGAGEGRGGFGSRGARSGSSGGGADETGDRRVVAAWAAVRHDGVQESGALPEGVRDNYMAEMAAQLSVAAHAGVRRVVIIFDATSPPEVLRRFVWSCRRKRQRVYRRDWLDTWWRQLQAFEVVVFVWQTSHVGAPVNEWADRAAAKAARAGLDEATPELLPVTYASLELERADGQLIRGGPRAVAAAAAQREIEKRLAASSGSAQMVESCDLELPRLPERLVVVAEAVLCGRAQIGDARRLCGRVARRMAKELGCPFGCGCAFAWHDVAFGCKGERLVRLREVWMAATEEARRVLTVRKPHSQWKRLQRRGTAGGGNVLRHGAAEEVELRRLVGGAVLNTGEHEIDGSASVCAAVGRAVRAGLELQAAGRAATLSFEWQVRKEVRRHAVAGRYARRWREATRHGGPRRVAALRDAVFVKGEAEDAVVRLEEEGLLQTGLQSEAGGLRGLKHWADLGAACAVMWTRARSIRSISPACALREWRWLAGLRLWRWKTMVSRGGMVDMPRPRQELQISAATGQRRVPLPQEWEQVMQAALGDLRSEVAFGLEVILMDVRCMDFGAYEARRRWLVGGGRRRLEWLRRWEVDEGREADSRGRWRVARVMNVRRPEHRHGQQLEVQVEWAGVDTMSGAAWSVEWVAITWCTGDVREEARRMEEAMYPTARRAEAAKGSRKSPRLLGGGGGGADGGDGGSGDDGEDDGSDGGGVDSRAAVGAAADPVGAARAAARKVARLNPTGRHRRRRPESADDEGQARGRASEDAEGPDAGGGSCANDAEVDDLEVLLDDVRGRAAGKEAMQKRKDAEADALMENGVRIHPYFRGRARQATSEGAGAGVGTGEGDPRCQAGHTMCRRATEAAGLTCDGGCGRALRRADEWWCCEQCDFDVCDACGGNERR